MANHRTFTDQNLLNAARELIVQERPINGNALRRIVGSGRPSVLMDAYNSLVEQGKVQLPVEKQPPVETMVSHDLPIEITDELNAGLQALTAMVKRCNDMAHHEVERRLNKAIQDAAADSEDSKQKTAEANENEARAWNDVENIRAELIEAEELTSEQAKRIVELEQQLMASEKVVKTLQDEAKQLNKQFADIKAELESEAKRTTAAETKRDVATEQLKKTENELKAERNNVTALRDEQTQAAAAIGELKGELKAEKARATKAEKELKGAADKAAATAETLKSTENELKAVKAELNTLINANSTENEAKK